MLVSILYYMVYSQVCSPLMQEIIAPLTSSEKPRLYPSISGNTGSAAAMSRVRMWMKHCFDTHRDCGPDIEGPLPSRVLDLGVGEAPSTIKLYLTNKNNGRYICLSHCWGTNIRHVTTTKATLEHWQSGVHISHLPRSFREAIIVTRQLGIRYLWIDSLCIIQDDDEDWQTESVQMAQIYQGCYLTIAATKASDDEGGLFSVTSPQYSERDICFDFAGTRTRFLYRRQPPDHDYWFRSGAVYSQTRISPPLLNRAWIYQERLLSPRILHFTNEELVFECRERSDCECGYDTHNKSMKVRHALALSSDQKALLSRWLCIVNEYSLLDLTYGKDKLPGLSGVAKQMQHLNGDSYLAGLWRSTLIQCLCWYNPGYNIIRGVGSHDKPETWRAPSWSWAHIDGCILFFSVGVDYSLVDIHVASCEHIGMDDTGEVTGGSISLSGRLAPVVLRKHAKKDQVTGKMALERVDIDTGDGFIASSKFHLDVWIDSKSLLSEKVSCLLLAKRADREFDICLILKEVSPYNGNVFERIGILSCKRGLVKDWMPATITII